MRYMKPSHTGSSMEAVVRLPITKINKTDTTFIASTYAQ